MTLPTPVREFLWLLARMTTPDEEFAASPELQREYEDADDYRADLCDERLCDDAGVLWEMIPKARRLLEMYGR